MLLFCAIDAIATKVPLFKFSVIAPYFFREDDNDIDMLSPSDYDVET
jgi:hypothetical protein